MKGFNLHQSIYGQPAKPVRTTPPTAPVQDKRPTVPPPQIRIVTQSQGSSQGKPHA